MLEAGGVEAERRKVFIENWVPQIFQRLVCVHQINLIEVLDFIDILIIPVEVCVLVSHFHYQYVVIL